MLTVVKPYTEEGVTRPRAVAHALKMARLMQWQKQQIQGVSNPEQNDVVVPSAHLMGSLLYFMIVRIEYCQDSHACDPSRSALFHWFDDTFRQVARVQSASVEEQTALRHERGDIVQFLLQEKPAFTDLSAALQIVHPYDFKLANVPKEGRMINESVVLSSRSDYSSMLQYLLRQYVNDGAELLEVYAKNHQILDMRFLLREMVHMRAWARGVGKAALMHEDYLLAAESYSFSGDFFQKEMQLRFLQFVEQKQSTIPDTCEHILNFIEQSKIDWFIRLKQIYQDASSLKAVATVS